MSENVSEFAPLMYLVARGNDQAIAQLLDRYNDTLMCYIRGHLQRRPLLRTLFDADWIANGIWWAILRPPTWCEQFATPEQLVAYLRGMARNQVRKAARDYLDAQKRNLSRRCHLSDEAVTTAADTVADRRPTPAEQAEFRDDWDQCLRSLTPLQQQFVLRRRAGFTFPEIAIAFGCSERTVERVAVGICHLPPTEPVMTW